MAPLLTVDLHSKRYPDAPEALLGGVAWQATAGEFIAVTGPSGCGKTTLLNIIAGLDGDYQGRVEIDQSPPQHSADVSFVFQDPRLLPWRTVRENIMLVLRHAPHPGQTADQMIRLVCLSGWEDAYPAQLSMGMARRVALARALAPCPRLLLLDEPFVSLDGSAAAALRLLLLQLLAETKAAAVFVTHNLDEALQLADRLLILNKGAEALRADLALAPPRAQRAQLRDAKSRQALAAKFALEYAELAPHAPLE